MSDTVGARFARGVATKDGASLREVLAPDVDFRGLTPGRAWEAAGAAALVDDILLGEWFAPTDEIRALEWVDDGEVADRRRVTYRMQVVNGDGTHVVEQTAYYQEVDGRISWMRVVCSGFRPVMG